MFFLKLTVWDAQMLVITKKNVSPNLFYPPLE